MSRTIQSLLDEYGESHKNSTNKFIHWICVPAIFWSIVALLHAIPTGFLQYVLGSSPFANWAVLTLSLVILYYCFLSIPLMLGMLVFGITCIEITQFVVRNFEMALWKIALIIFLIAWIGQFYGHKIEGKKPSFLKDLQFLLIGPAWLLSFIYLKLGIKY